MDIDALGRQAWWTLPLLIFVARVLDVTLGTLRIAFISRGQRLLAPLLGFFEVFIWIVAIGQIVRDISNIASYVAYAAGFAAGNYIGLILEERLAIGTLVVRIIMPSSGGDLAQRLRDRGYGVTTVDARGAVEKVTIIFTAIKRKDLHDVVAIVTEVAPKAFFSVEELRSVREGVFRGSASPPRKRFLRLFNLISKRK